MCSPLLRPFDSKERNHANAALLGHCCVKSALRSQHDPAALHIGDTLNVDPQDALVAKTAVGCSTHPQ
jgi:hypothetical protein